MKTANRHPTGVPPTPLADWLTRLRWLSLAALISVGPAGTVANGDFPRPISAPLATPFQIIAEGNTLSDAVAELRQRTALRVWIDRRVDPSLPLLPAPYGPTARDVLERLATENSFEMAVADEVVLLGPGSTADRAATEMMAARDRLDAWQRSAASSSGSPLTAPRPIAWPMLTTPEKALAIVADSWDLDVSAVSLPHDLWPAVDLGEVDVTTALGVIGVGFDLALDIEPAQKRVTPRPLSAAPQVLRQYPAGRVPQVVRNQIASPEVGGQLRQRDERWSLRGSARAHTMLEMALDQRGASAKPDPRVTAAPGEPRYSLRLVNKPAGDFLRAVCESAGWQLEIAPAAADRLTERIDLEVDQATLDELVERAITPLGLDAQRQATRLQITVADER